MLTDWECAGDMYSLFSRLCCIRLFVARLLAAAVEASSNCCCVVVIMIITSESVSGWVSEQVSCEKKDF